MILPASFDQGDFRSLTICRTSEGWQASLEVETGSFRIRQGATPSLALGALFAAAPAQVLRAPPLPY